MDNTRRYYEHTPTVSFADREDYRPKSTFGYDRFNPYNPLALQRSRRELKAVDNSYVVGYCTRVERIDYTFSSEFQLNGRMVRGFKTNDEQRSLFNQWITGKL